MSVWQIALECTFIRTSPAFGGGYSDLFDPQIVHPPCHRGLAAYWLAGAHMADRGLAAYWLADLRYGTRASPKGRVHCRWSIALCSKPDFVHELPCYVYDLYL